MVDPQIVQMFKSLTKFTKQLMANFQAPSLRINGKLFKLALLQEGVML